MPCETASMRAILYSLLGLSRRHSQPKFRHDALYESPHAKLANLIFSQPHDASNACLRARSRMGGRHPAAVG